MIQSLRKSAARILAAIGLVSPFVSLSALADEQDTLNVRFTESYAHDNNLFRLPDGIDPSMVGLGKSDRSDSIRTDSLSLTADKQYSLQHFHLGARFDANHYSHYDFLDHNTRNFDGRWNWSLTPHITGILAAERSQTLNNFADYQNYVRSIRTTDSVRGDSEFGSIGALRFVAGIAQSKTTNSEPIQQEWNTRTRNAYGGLRYLTAAGNFIGYRYRENRVEWLGRPLDTVNLYDTEARQGDHEIYGEWELAAQAAIEGAIAQVRRRHENFSERDYTGTAGHLNLNWLPDTQLRFTLYAKRDYASWWSSTASYTVTDSFGLVPTWQITPKISLYGRAEHSQREFRSPVIATTADPRLDKLTSYQLGLDWQPVRFLAIGGDVARSRRTSNAPGLDFTDTTASLHAQLSF